MGVKCVTGYTTAGSCAPSCENVGDGEAVYDPKNCQNFYVCQNGEPSEPPLSCGSNEYFDGSIGECVPGTCLPSFCIPQCNYEPWRGAGYLADRTDCSKYYLYDGINTLIPGECNAGHYFNGKDCTSTDPNDCCDPCLVFCETGGKTVADPLDCEKYYYCSKDYYFPDTSISCQSHEKYNFLTAECNSVSTCLQLC